MPGSGLLPPGMMPPGVFPTGPPIPSHPGASQSPPQQRPTPESQRQARPKRLKAHTVTSKSYSIPMVPRDKGGRPMLPLNVGIMTVISLGEVCMREHFHTERYIFPVGYEVTRRYLSTIDPNIEVVYHCTILDGGDGPKFQIVPSDVADKPVIAGTATGAWSSIVKQANAIRNRQHSNSVSGPDFFGLGQNTIKHLIQQLPNADKLRDYVWQNFVEGGPLGGRHAAVIPALPEEYDSSMPIGPYYPSTSEKLRREQLAVQAGQPRKSHYPPHVMARAAQEAQNSARQQQQAHPPPQPIPQPQPMPQQSLPTSQPQPQPPPLHPQHLGISESATDAATFASLISAYGAAQAGAAPPAGMMAGGPPPSGPPPS
ncbi:F/Y rich C-terminus-domain-containing protein [Armillaria luteobubalina]|uniref:F/Y rich C-terminus-domain-containing protein n=1 Tax=Armillaria luteobubalina TaxID=153913 RepID=A0AA39QJW1_9AGAR|nr:F/Y rich C-terminus-domain-containing protein [Armillaria luteobubalina]